ncbi:hypothetical protein QBC40DRAFT_227328 [Triangularia verruculosa]|uniref:Uncharacterized protein n=1 Tax=Triangularia verruculosa TaxID=2587418 RepID=A0AAN6XJS5_9PEZI|nr:hypothetical protein QBC40DRAFT_227328 [Triangularia verruculosa]
MTLHIPILKLPLLLHLLVETPASLSFLLLPEAQLPGPSPEATLILRNFGGLLLSTNLIALVFLLRPHFDSLSALVTLCLGTYHVWPIYRAYSRLKHTNLGQKKKETDRKVFGGPIVHFWVHLFCLVALVVSGWYGLD